MALLPSLTEWVLGEKSPMPVEALTAQVRQLAASSAGSSVNDEEHSRVKSNEQEKLRLWNEIKIQGGILIAW